MTFTKEQLIEKLKHRISVASEFPESEKAQMDLDLARIALASLEAEPVAYIFKHPAGKLFWALTDESNKDQSDVIPVYAAPPVPVVPEEKPMPNPLKMYAVDAVAAIAEVRGWNACRAAMLQGKSEQPQNAQQNIPENIPGGNSPVIPDGWISCSERMPEDTKMLLAFSQGEIVAAYWNWVVNPIDYKKYRAFTYLSGNILDDVTHWMPLPEPPL
ncbi:DUF551 domain-containing protein [Escherichia coli]|uniref:DUF551 domain-containing protein n=1 Tax=Escherichia coli TaxID=562 RepID=UPI001CA7A4F7|nr:DUF551 domain-containing protein [Escherichia coli]